MASAVEIAFDCLPLRLIGRLDTPLDASEVYRARQQRIAAALENADPQRSYYLYNARCVFRLANSEIEGMVRFEFEGIVVTDASDLLTERVDLNIQLVSETWLARCVERAVAIEFDRFIAAGQLSQRTSELGTIERLSDLTGFSGMHV